MPLAGLMIGNSMTATVLLAGSVSAQYLDVAAGRDFSLALRDDGKVIGDY